MMCAVAGVTDIKETWWGKSAPCRLGAKCFWRKRHWHWDPKDEWLLGEDKKRGGPERGYTKRMIHCPNWRRFHGKPSVLVRLGEREAEWLSVLMDDLIELSSEDLAEWPKGILWEFLTVTVASGYLTAESPSILL